MNEMDVFSNEVSPIISEWEDGFGSLSTIDGGERNNDFTLRNEKRSISGFCQLISDG